MYGIDEETKDDCVWLDFRPPPQHNDDDYDPNLSIDSWKAKKREDDRDKRIQKARREAWSDLLQAEINHDALMLIAFWFRSIPHQNFHHGKSFDILVRRNLLSCIDLASLDFAIELSPEEMERAIKAVKSDLVSDVRKRRPSSRTYDWNGIGRSLIRYPGVSKADFVRAARYVYKVAWRMIYKTAPRAINGHFRKDSLEIFMIYCHYEAARFVEDFYYRHPEIVRAVMRTESLVCPFYIDTQESWQQNTGVSGKAWYSARKEYNSLIKANMPSFEMHRYMVGHTNHVPPDLTDEDKKLLRAIKGKALRRGRAR